MSQQLPSFLEDYISQIPALQVLQNLGWKYVTAAEALAMRGGKMRNVLLESVLLEQLRKLNRVRFKGGEYPFSEANIQSALQALKDVMFDGLVRTNEKLYDLLVLGKSLQQTIDGDTKSFLLNYIDWNPETWLTRNVFHVVEEYSVERAGSYDTRRPDLVLFVNGIPLCVIECKRPDEPNAIDEAISQHCRNQFESEIPGLYVFSQLLLAVSKNEAKYATTGTPAKFWAVWREDVETELTPIVNEPLSDELKERLFADKAPTVREWFDKLEKKKRAVTEQDRALFCLCRPERLLDLTLSYVLYDAGEKKIARYQQYFTVKTILERIQRRDESGSRVGGVVWHTQGSGKSLTMVMLGKALARLGLAEYKIILVTDRVDLDDQIYKTFKHCAMEPYRARSGRDLAAQIQDQKSRVITTVIDKFESALLKANLNVSNENIFVLVDESHRGNYGPMHGRMRKALPRSCFIGFTGTPVQKKEKNTITKFGGLIQPTYSIHRAVDDKAVVPLLYEGRDVEQRVDKASIDRWFDVITANLTTEQKADLKKKFTTTDQLNMAEQKVREIALDISMHYRDNWQRTPYKAQLVTQNKATALSYKKFLDEFAMVSSEVLISGPDDREGNDEVDEDKIPAVVQFWKKMMAKHGSEEQYNKNVINSFKHGEEPEIIIVVDKLLTGFDAPRNTVLYLTRKLEGHTLLQAIARVNRLYDGKDFGYIIDYRGVLGSLNKAFDLYGKMEEYDAKDLEGTVTDVAEEIDKLPRRYTDLLDVFQEVKNKKDEEQYEQLLADQDKRDQFYECLRDYARSLAVAMSSTRFIEQTPNAKLEKYRKDLTFFMSLRSAVRRRYAEVVDFKEYESRIQKLIDTHVSTGKVEKVTELVNIFDRDAFRQEVERVEGVASKADTIAYRTKKTIQERMDDDPAFFKRFSEMLEEAIRAWRERRIADREYLNTVVDIADAIQNRKDDHLPEPVRQRDVAKAFYGVMRDALANYQTNGTWNQSVAETAVAIDDVILRDRIVNWVNNSDVQNKMRTSMEDLLFDLKRRTNAEFGFDEIDAVMDRCLVIARRRYGE